MDSRHDEAACRLCCGTRHLKAAARRSARPLVLFGIIAIFIRFLFSLVGAMPWQRQVDPLEDAASVARWTKGGIELTDGTRISLSGIREISGSRRALDRLVERGVEVQPDGHLAVLVRIRSWCGNCDAATIRRLKCDLSALLVFLGLATSDRSIKQGSERGTFIGRHLDDEADWEFGMGGGDFQSLENFCAENGIPLAEHSTPRLAIPW